MSAAAATTMTPAQAEEALADDIGSFALDPLGYVLYAFPWGEPGTALAKHSGPRPWQRAQLQSLGEKLRAGLLTQGEVIQEATASGHGIGKSAEVAMVAKWALDTCVDTRVLITANTGDQLLTKTWPELSKWHNLSITKHWFTLTATALYSNHVDPDGASHEKAWRADAATWSENNTEAFAGLHNEGKRLLLIFDEASKIADKVWEVAEGALTDANTEIIWLAYGNPTRNTGRFSQCFGSLAHRWGHRQIDSRTVEGTNKLLIERWINDYGEDSDFVRVRVRGMFPRSGSLQFIPSDIATAAAKREATANIHDALVLGVDVAREGDDQSVIYTRKGRDARTHAPIKLRVPDLMQLAARVAAHARELNADAVFVDGGGLGGGVVDRLRQLNVPNVYDIKFGAGSDDAPKDEAGIKYANKRAEMYGKLKRWLKDGGAVPDDPELHNEMTAIEYGHNQRDEILLEKKKDMKKRGLSSPDNADGLVLTFAYHVDRSLSAGRTNGGAAGGVASEYDPYADA